MLNNSITRALHRPTPAGALIDRYVLPDGELTGSGTVITAAEDAGFEVMQAENLQGALRPHPAGLERTPGGELGRLRRRGRAQHCTVVGR